MYLWRLQIWASFRVSIYDSYIPVKFPGAQQFFCQAITGNSYTESRSCQCHLQPLALGGVKMLTSPKAGSEQTNRIWHTKFEREYVPSTLIMRQTKGNLLYSKRNVVFWIFSRSVFCSSYCWWTRNPKANHLERIKNVVNDGMFTTNLNWSPRPSLFTARWCHDHYPDLSSCGRAFSGWASFLTKVDGTPK